MQKKVGQTTTITLTKKDGTEKTVHINDGVDLQFMWQDTSLGIKTAEQSEYTFVDLQGEKGEKGDTGAKGNKGDSGTDGISPVVSINKSGKSTTIQITDVNGTHTATINDGKDGNDSGDMLTSVYDIDKDGIVDNAKRVNGHTVESNVPANAQFTDTIYDDSYIKENIQTNATNIANNTKNIAKKANSTINNNVDVLGTTKSTESIGDNQLLFYKGAIFGGTAMQAGLVTRGICGITTPDSKGACGKENLYVNYDGGSDYNAKRQLVIQADNVGNHYGNNLYQYAAARGDAVKGYVDKAISSAVKGKYTKPETGIPKTDLAGTVQTSLDKADTAIQSSNFVYDSTTQTLTITTV